MNTETPEEKIRRLEKMGYLAPDCRTCQDDAYPALIAGKAFPFGPSHRASDRCLSGRRNHCSCDTCF